MAGRHERMTIAQVKRWLARKERATIEFKEARLDLPAICVHPCASVATLTAITSWFGSGILNVNKYLPFYTKGGKPQFIEGDPFVTIIPLPAETEAAAESEEKSEEKSKEKNSDRLVALLRQNPAVTTEEMAAALELSRAGIEKIIRNLKKSGDIRRIGPDKGGHWEVLPTAAPRKEEV